MGEEGPQPRDIAPRARRLAIAASALIALGATAGAAADHRSAGASGAAAGSAVEPGAWEAASKAALGRPRARTGGRRRAGPRLRIVTRRQRALLNRGGLIVRLRSPRAARVRLSARRGGERSLFRKRRLRLRAGRARRVRIRLTDRGRDALRLCGAHRIAVRAVFRIGGRRRVVRRARTLTRAPDCILDLAAPNADRCDPLDAAACLAPYPNDYYTVADPSTDTGRRLNLHPDSAPENLNGKSIFHPELNRNDGFSPNNVIVTRVPGIETPDAFRANGLVPQVNIGAYDDPGQRLVLINAETGERQPIWAELDMIPGTPNPHAGGAVEGTADDRLLLIHPAVALDYGARYIVALRGLTDVHGGPLNPNPVFRAYRDRRRTNDPAIEARRGSMERIFSDLAAAGIGRNNLYIAWDFTVASERNLTERLLAMRDDALAQLGDTNLADEKIEPGSGSPQITVTGQLEYALCDFNGDPRCELDAAQPESDYAFKRVTGTIEVPCYMNAPGVIYNFNQPGLPCAPGSRLHYEPGSDLPSQNGTATWQAPFTCIIPRAAKQSGEMATGRPGIVFGHGLFQNHRTVEALGLFPAALEGVACGTDWIGFSAFDPITGEQVPNSDLDYLVNMLGIRQDLSLFSALPDRSQQGYVNALYLARAMAHPDGLAALPEFHDGGASALQVDPEHTASDLAYHGISLGGIFGGATTSVAPDWKRAVLGVPGMGFTTLLTRSTQFNAFLPAVFEAYPDPLSRQIGISMLQLVWDRGEPSAYVHRMTDQPLADTPPHQVMIQEAFGDHQVTNVQTETLARTLDAAVRIPTVDPGRLDDRPYLFSDTVVPFWTAGQDQIDSSDLDVPGGYTGSSAVIFTLDTGPIRIESNQFVGSNPNPDWNIAPVDRSGVSANDGLDPHEPVATSPAAQQMAIPFLLGQGIYDPCVSDAPGSTEMPPWSVPYSGDPLPCLAPPLHSPGQGQ